MNFQGPTFPFKVQALCWNPNSDILAVALEEVSSSSDSIANFLQLWTIGNYHWYLKQTLVLYRRPLMGNPSTSTSTTMLWDGLAPNRLHVVGGDGKYRALEWSWGVRRYEHYLSHLFYSFSHIYTHVFFDCVQNVSFPFLYLYQIQLCLTIGFGSSFGHRR